MQHYQTPCLRQTWFSRSDSFLQDVMPRKTPLQQLWIVLSCVCVYQDVWKLLSSLKPTWVKFCSSFLRDSMADFWSDCARITAKMRTTAYWTNRVEHSMSKPETPVWRSTLKTVSEFAANIPKTRYSDYHINNGISRANKMILPGRLKMMKVLYLRGWRMAA